VNGSTADPTLERLRRDELPVETIALARFLIGKVLVRELADGIASGRIVETEAYTLGDPACHAFNGRTPRNAALFLPPGHAYVYIAYGTAMMMNVSSEPAGVGAGVLIRALEPLAGIDIMQQNRGNVPERDLARGPGRLAKALAIDRSLDGVDLCAPGPLWLGSDRAAVVAPGESVRIGLTKAADRVQRYFVRGSPYVSGPRAWNR
jgi:DNA-3-methyladenine glycosylase